MDSDSGGGDVAAPTGCGTARRTDARPRDRESPRRVAQLCCIGPGLHRSRTASARRRTERRRCLAGRRRPQTLRPPRTSAKFMVCPTRWTPMGHDAGHRSGLPSTLTGSRRRWNCPARCRRPGNDPPLQRSARSSVPCHAARSAGAKFNTDQLATAGQVTDFHLLAVARATRSDLITLDRSVPTYLAVPTSTWRNCWYGGAFPPRST